MKNKLTQQELNELIGGRAYYLQETTSQDIKNDNGGNGCVCEYRNDGAIENINAQNTSCSCKCI